MEKTKKHEIEVTDIQHREFGFSILLSDNQTRDEKKIFCRKVYLRNTDDFDKYLEQNNVLDAYVSTAYWERPWKMEGWLGADLFFDFDYPEDISIPRMEAKTVIQSLKDDFGLDDVYLIVSGGKGYHVICEDKRIRSLGKTERGEIVQWITTNKDISTLDIACTIDTHRLRRVPGSYHHNGNPCRILKKV